MFTIDLQTVFQIALRTFLVYVIVLIGLRVAGKREIGQMTVFDLVVLLLIANAVQNAMVGPDTSLTGGVFAALLLLLFNGLVSQLRLRSPRLRRWVEGSPTILVLDGKPIPENMYREGVDQETLETALREHGLAKLEDAEMVVLEIDGAISVIPAGEDKKRIKHPRKMLRRN